MRNMLPFLLLWIASHATAQQSEAVALSGFGYFNNVYGETPCVVASKIFASCQNAQFTLWGLPAGNWAYPGPTNTSEDWWDWNRCDCSMPVYNLLSACAQSQGASWPSFPDHTRTCTVEYTGDTMGAVYSLPIQTPSNTQLPSQPLILLDVTTVTMFTVWAQYNSSTNHGATFNDKQARIAAGLVEEKKSGPNKTPFLIGGVVGVTALLGIGVLVLIWSRRRSIKKREQALKKMVAAQSGAGSPSSESSQGHGSEHSVKTSETHFKTFAFPPPDAPKQQRKLRSRSRSRSMSKSISNKLPPQSQLHQVTYPLKSVTAKSDWSHGPPKSDTSHGLNPPKLSYWNRNSYSSSNGTSEASYKLEPPDLNRIHTQKGSGSDRSSNHSWFAGSDYSVASITNGQISPIPPNTNFSSMRNPSDTTHNVTQSHQHPKPIAVPRFLPSQSSPSDSHSSQSHHAMSTRITDASRDVRMPLPQATVAYPGTIRTVRKDTIQKPKNVPELQEQNTEYAFYPTNNR